MSGRDYEEILRDEIDREELKADHAHQDWLDDMSDEETEERTRRLDVFAAQVRVGLGWIDLEVRP